MKNTLKQTKHQTKSQFVYKHTLKTKAAGIKVFLWSKKMRALSRERTNRLVPKNQDRPKSTP